MPQMLVTLNVRFLQIQKSVKFSNLQLWVSSPIHCQMYARISFKHEQMKRTCISMGYLIDCYTEGQSMVVFDIIKMVPGDKRLDCALLCCCRTQNTPDM